MSNKPVFNTPRKCIDVQRKADRGGEVSCSILNPRILFPNISGDRKDSSFLEIIPCSLPPVLTYEPSSLYGFSSDQKLNDILKNIRDKQEERRVGRCFCAILANFPICHFSSKRYWVNVVKRRRRPICFWPTGASQPASQPTNSFLPSFFLCQFVKVFLYRFSLRSRWLLQLRLKHFTALSRVSRNGHLIPLLLYYVVI